jgi:hypothetical protein
LCEYRRCKATTSSRPPWVSVLSLLRLVPASPSCAAAVPVASSLLFLVVVASIPPVVAAPSSLPHHAARLAESVSRVVRSPPVGALPSLSAVLSWSSALDFFFFRFASFGFAVCSHRSIDVLLLPSGRCVCVSLFLRVSGIGSLLLLVLS